MKKLRVILGYAMFVMAVGLPLTGAILMSDAKHVAEIQPIDPSSTKIVKVV